MMREVQGMFLLIVFSAAASYGSCDSQLWKWGPVTNGMRVGICLEMTKDIAVAIQNTTDIDAVLPLGWWGGRAVPAAISMHLAGIRKSLDIFVPGSLYVAGRHDPLILPLLAHSTFVIHFAISVLRANGGTLDEVIQQKDTITAYLHVSPDACRSSDPTQHCWSGDAVSGTAEK